MLICICPCVCWFRLNLSPFQSSFSKYPNIKTFYGARRIMICAWLPVCHVCLLGAHWCEKLGLLSWYFYPNRQVISGFCLKWSFASWKSKIRKIVYSHTLPGLQTVRLVRVFFNGACFGFILAYFELGLEFLAQIWNLNDAMMEHVLFSVI